jgi:DNA-binding IclR family transcriptional regulator
MGTKIEVIAASPRPTATRTPQIRAVARAMTVLQCFQNAPTLSLADITRASGLDKGTVRRLLGTLETQDFVTYDPASLQYCLGAQLRRLAAGALGSLDLRSMAVPALYALASELSVTAYLSVYRDGCAICLERIHETNGFAVQNWKVGGTMPLNCGGAPKLLTAYQSPAEIERALREPLPALTPKTITSRESLRRRLKQIRARGWELAVDDVVVGLSTLAVPILAQDGKLVCAISIAGLTPQLYARGRPPHLDRFLAVAENIRARLPDTTLN